MFDITVCLIEQSLLLLPISDYNKKGEGPKMKDRTIARTAALLLLAMLFAVSTPVYAKKIPETGTLQTMFVATGQGEEVALFKSGKIIYQPVIDVDTSYYSELGALPWIEIEGATWITYDYEVSAPSDNSWYIYKKTFDIPGEVVEATMTITADNAYMLHVNGRANGNGRLVGRDGNTYQPTPDIDPKNWQTPEVYDVTKALRDGSNNVVVYVRNYGMTDGSWENNPTGLVFSIAITYIE
jgi:hypothetical protein